MNRQPRSKREWDDLARERDRNPGRRGSWQVGMVFLLALLAIFVVVAFLVPSVAAKVVLGIGMVIYVLGTTALRRRSWDLQAQQQIRSRSVTGSWMDAAVRRERGSRRRR